MVGGLGGPVRRRGGDGWAAHRPLVSAPLLVDLMVNALGGPTAGRGRLRQGTGNNLYPLYRLVKKQILF